MVLEGFELIAQGAEARIYRGSYLGRDTLVKERFKKTYRHPDLDETLSKDRVKNESRAIVRAKIAGVSTPTIFYVDLEERSIYMEYINDAIALKFYINSKIGGKTDDKNWMKGLGESLGILIAKLHSKHLIHGDLTTSNILIKNELIDEEKTRNDAFIFIDFGLARIDSTAEDKAVDLYVLERSLLSSHSQVPELFSIIMNNYQEHVDDKQRREIVTKYEEVRARGRKRLMIG
ncbi:TP53-regulating kinase [Fopius arisanus]|uniref:non-specific serine/threonine protein kinase n=1 Tax=Fopius arisanus TaxID=64838 RepID=A0A0C9R7Y2_9HYME|nr:PREDICTED: TP53-regulating kinase [Fopius arisanus]